MTDPTQPPEGLSNEDLKFANQQGWNEAAESHRAHPQFAALLEAFAKPGFSCFDDYAKRRLKKLDLTGKSVAQLCCNNARELLSIKNMGAGRCVGFDFAEAFLEHIPTTWNHLTGMIFRSEKARFAMRCSASDKSRNAVRAKKNPAFGGL